ncbi:MAG: PadR family transcriptional regulator [Treponema sp.]|nr:PadR family transcriptional regulator [Treponema sp.]
MTSDQLRGHMNTIVLCILKVKDSYGFEIYNQIIEKTWGQYEPKEMTLYSCYKRLEADGCITSYWGDETQGARRKYYKITEKGRKALDQGLKDWQFTQKVISSLLEE